MSHFDYCANIWGHCSIKLLLRIERLQKAVARVLLDCDFYTPSDVLFHSLQWMPFRKRVLYNEAILMYKVHNNLAPDYLNNFKNIQNVHSRNTRSAARDDLYIPKHRTQIFKRSFAYSGVKVWNSLPVDIKSCPSLQAFKNKCKCYFSESV